MSARSHQEILAIHRAALAIGLDRTACLAGLPRSLVASLSTARTQSEQILSDLDDLNRIKTLADGSVPLLQWLRNAEALAGPRTQALIFTTAIEHIESTRTSIQPRTVAQRDDDVGSHDREDPSMMNGSDRKKLHNALLNAFPTADALARLVRFGLDENLENITSRGNLADRTFDLIEWAESQGRTLDLFRAARQEVPGNVALAALEPTFRPEVRPPNPPTIPVVEPSHVVTEPRDTNWTSVQLTLDGDYSAFDQEKRDQLRAALAKFLGLSVELVRIISVKEGSIKITIEMPNDAAVAIAAAFAKGDPDFLKILQNNVVDVSLVPRVPAEIDWKNPGAVLSAAIEAVPVVKYALGVAGVAAVVAIVTKGFGLDAGTAVVGTLVVFAFMIVLLILAASARLQHHLRAPAVVLTWWVLCMVVAGSLLLFTSFFFDMPKNTRCLFYGECPPVPSPHPGPNPSAVITPVITVVPAIGNVCTVDANGLLKGRHMSIAVDLSNIESAAERCWASAKDFCGSYATDSMIDSTLNITNLKCSALLTTGEGNSVSKSIDWNDVIKCSMIPLMHTGRLHVQWGTAVDDAQARGMIGLMKNRLLNTGSAEGKRWSDAILKGAGVRKIAIYFEGVDSDAICGWVHKCSDVHEQCESVLMP